MIILEIRTIFEVIKLLAVCYILLSGKIELSIKKCVFVVLILGSELFLYKYFSASVLFALLILLIIIEKENRIWSAFYSHVMVQVIDNMSAVMLSGIIKGIGQKYVSLGNTFEREIVELIIIIFICFVIRFFIGKDHMRLPKMGVKDYISVVIVGIIMFFMSGSSRLIIDDIVSPEAQKIFIIADFMLMIVLLSIFYFQNYLLFSRNNYKELYEAKEELLSERERYLEEQSEQYNNMLMFRHNMEHYFDVVDVKKELCDTELNDYTNEIRKFVNDNFSPLDCGDSVISCLLLNYRKKAKENGVDFSWSGHVYNETKLSDIDKATIIGNLLKNAYESSRKCNDKKYMSVEIMNYKDDTLFVIKNSTPEADIIDATTLKTQKEDKNNHGLGIKSIKKIVDKYPEMMYTAKIEKKEYVAKVVLPGKVTNRP